MLEGCEVFTTCEIVLGECKRFAFERHADVNTGHKELVVVKNTARDLESEYYLDDEGSATTPTGKKARRMRQMRMMEMERERLQQGGGGERRGLFSRIAAVIVPPPTPIRTVNEVADEV